MENKQRESKKQAEVRAGSNNHSPRTIQSQKQKENQTREPAQKCRPTVQEDFAPSEFEHKVFIDRLTG